MSLQSNGSRFNINVPLGEFRVYQARGSYSGLKHPQEVKPFYENHHLCAGNSLEAKKKAFMELMQDFANSAEFEVLTYELSNNFKINITHDINLSMPTRY